MHEMMCIVYHHSVGNKIKGRMAAGVEPGHGLVCGVFYFLQIVRLTSIYYRVTGEIKNYSKLR